MTSDWDAAANSRHSDNDNITKADKRGSFEPRFLSVS